MGLVRDDAWHGSEDYPAPRQVHFGHWEEEMDGMWGQPPQTNFDRFLRRMLMVGAVAMVWVLIGFVLTVAVRGNWP